MELEYRNVHVYESVGGAEVAGFYQHGGVSISTFVRWLEEVIVCDVVHSRWTLYPCEAAAVRIAIGEPLDLESKTDIQPGKYVICSLDKAAVALQLTHDVPRTRAYSTNYTHTARSTNFTSRVRNRDGRCCFTNTPVLPGRYGGFHVAHIFPLSETDAWNHDNFKQFITDDRIREGNEINSVQNGFLCRADHHQWFNDCEIGINPDDNYKITDFVYHGATPHGNTFYRNPNIEGRFQPSDELLRDHFRQCILKSVKGVPQPEAQFDPDVHLGQGGFNLESGGWWATDAGSKQLEAELGHRLWSWVGAV